LSSESQKQSDWRGGKSVGKRGFIFGVGGRKVRIFRGKRERGGPARERSCELASREREEYIREDGEREGGAPHNL